VPAGKVQGRTRLKARKVLFVTACIAVALTGILAATSGAKGSSAKTRVTVYKWPNGLFGYVKSPKHRCASHRRVVVFEQRGQGQHPRRDDRLGSTKTQRSNGFQQWTLETSRSGRLYAKARRTRGCKASFSRILRNTPQSGGGGGGEDGSVPPCSPYVSEGVGNICKFNKLHLDSNICPSFTKSSGSCVGYATGLYPWDGGEAPKGEFSWDRAANRVLYVAYPDGDSSKPGMAHLGGTVPGPGSKEFTITDGFAQNEKGYPNGDHFYTPDLPGQAAGEEGGPLYLDFVNGKTGADIYIHGFLYLKP
jgi:hypothetical protein